MCVTNYVVQPQDWDERGRGTQSAGLPWHPHHRQVVDGQDVEAHQQEAPAWVIERLKELTRLIAPMEAEEKAMTEAIEEKGAETQIPRGLGA